MKRISKRSLLRIAAILLLAAIIGAAGYLFVFGRAKPLRYLPQMDYSFLQSEIERLAPIGEDTSGEVLLFHDGFRGILQYGCSKSSAEEIKAYFEYLSHNPYDGTHYTFPDDAYEIFVGDAQYNRITKAWGYGWLHYEGNLYARRNGTDAAAGKPNFRNCFDFTIRKADAQFVFTVYCNTSDAETALTEAIDYVNAH